jgi:hypothetical protein
MQPGVSSAWTELAGDLGQLGLDILGGAPVTITEERFADPKVLGIMRCRGLSQTSGLSSS